MAMPRHPRQKTALHAVHISQPKKELAEFGKGKKTFMLCSLCGAIYFDKSWHHSFLDYRKKIGDQKITVQVCPACQMIADRMFEGELIIARIDPARRQDLLNTITNSADRAFQRDVLCRVITKEPSGDTLRVTTTENQLAIALGKELRKAFGGTLHITFSKQESTARVYLVL